jgi:predicted transcriptional regulator
MPRKPKCQTITTTIRLESDLRDMLEHIAAREYRSLTNQMTLFLRDACDSYMEIHDLRRYRDVDAFMTSEEHADYLKENSPD